MSDGSADDELAAFIDRILRMKDEADAIAADIKEIYAEAHGRGYNKTRLGEVVTKIRKREKDAAGEEEKAAIRDLYEEAYYRSKNKPHAYARARSGEIIEPQPTKAAGQARGDAASSIGDASGQLVTSSVENEAAEISTPITEQQSLQAASDLTSSSLGQVATHTPETATPVQDAKAMKVDTATVVTPEPAQEAQILRPGPLYAAPGVVTHEHAPPEPVKWHPYAQCFPTVLGDDLKELEKDIHASFGGVRAPIVKIGNLILDGRARYGIARSLLIDYPVKQYEGTDPLIDVIAWNLASRQDRMTQAQMVSAAKALEKLEPSRADDIMQAFGLETAEAAQ